MIDRTRVQHEPDSDCTDTHCYSCHVDEHFTGYITCPECFHTYRTAGELRRAYRRELIHLHRTRPGFEDPSWWQVLWKAATIRAKNIYFCQHCIHDF